MPHLLSLALEFVGRMDLKTLMRDVPLVCRRWKTVCREEVVPDTISFRWAHRGHFDILASDSELHCMVKRFRSGVRTIDCEGCVRITDHFFLDQLSCPQLTSLNLTDCMLLSDASVASFVTRCPRLSSLNLSGIWNITD